MAEITRYLKHRRDTAANWTANNPILLAGQLGIETDGLTTTPKFKIGDGTSTWTALPYFYGGSASAQDLNNVLTVGNTTSGQDIVLTDDDKLQIGSTAGRYIGYDTNLIQIGLGIVNTNSNDHIILQDGGGIHVDTTFVELPHLTASRVIATDANNRLSALTGTGFLTLNAGVISYDSNTYLTTSAAALAYQPLDSDLTSWAGVTRASGFDTFTATPSSANLSSLLTDKTGTGVNVFGTSPTFTTDITTPLIIGGSAVGSTIQYKGTSGNGTSTVAAHQFLVGNNGATTAAQIFNSGQVSLGNYASPTNLRLFTIGQDSAWLSIGSRSDGAAEGCIYINAATPSTGNFALSGISGETRLNGTSRVDLRINNANQIRITGSDQTFSPSGASSGAATSFTFTNPTNTGQTASTEISNFKVNGASKTWAAGAITTQRWNYFTANTAAFASASTITDSYGLFVERAVAGTNATITNNWAIGTDGDIYLSGGNRNITSSNAISIRAASGSNATLLAGGTGLAGIGIFNETLALQCKGYAASGAITAFSFFPASCIGQTASTEINSFLYNSFTRTWAAGAITTQREHYLKTVTYAFASASTITNSYGLYVEAATAGTNATITNNWALGTNGGIFLNGTANTVLGNAALATNATTGFLHVPSCAGTPTGTPTLYTGMIPVCADSTNNKLYIYSGGAWVALN